MFFGTVITMKKVRRNNRKGRKNRKNRLPSLSSDFQFELKEIYNGGFFRLLLTSLLVVFLIFDFISVFSTCEIRKMRIPGLINCFEEPGMFSFTLIVKLVVFIISLGYLSIFCYGAIKRIISRYKRKT